MRVVLHFHVDEVVAQAAHAIHSRTHRATQADLSDPVLFADGPDATGTFDMASIRLERIEPRLILAKDKGCYLVSSGIPGIAAGARKTLVAYALGLDDKVEPARVDHLLGAERFAMPIPATLFIDAMRLANQVGAKYFRLSIMDGQVTITHTGASDDRLNQLRNFND